MIAFKELADAGINNVFKNFTANGGERNWTVIIDSSSGALFVKRKDIG